MKTKLQQALACLAFCFLSFTGLQAHIGPFVQELAQKEQAQSFKENEQYCFKGVDERNGATHILVLAEGNEEYEVMGVVQVFPPEGVEGNPMSFFIAGNFEDEQTANCTMYMFDENEEIIPESATAFDLFSLDESSMNMIFDEGIVSLVAIACE